MAPLIFNCFVSAPCELRALTSITWDNGRNFYHFSFDAFLIYDFNAMRLLARFFPLSLSASALYFILFYFVHFWSYSKQFDATYKCDMPHRMIYYRTWDVWVGVQSTLHLMVDKSVLKMS